MRQDIHPEYSEIKATCSCGNVMLIKTTLKEDIILDVCSSCHPFYTGKQKLVDTGGRVERFEKRFGKKTKTEIKVEKEDSKEKLEVQELENKEIEKKKESEKSSPKIEAKKKQLSTKKASEKKIDTKEKKKDSKK